MAIPNYLLDQVAYIKDQIKDSDLSESEKLLYTMLLDKSLETTNGLSVEEKIQNLTELTCAMIITKIQDKLSLDESINNRSFLTKLSNLCLDKYFIIIVLLIFALNPSIIKLFDNLFKYICY